VDNLWTTRRGPDQDHQPRSGGCGDADDLDPVATLWRSARNHPCSKRTRGWAIPMSHSETSSRQLRLTACDHSWLRRFDEEHWQCVDCFFLVYLDAEDFLKPGW